ncbi:hypothetical protein BDY21DRAFT_307977 [Lineolata rhizophorae]|uniref:PWI domain-containing protein n=1 Tax=Lineolata rhizophorae TaxID=578093 RepID=A0A6A6NUF1_9PEZI|nr:hypothetical protein BDY21DRAFT_307977 [Lineolata rhizophorae]
MYPYNNAPGQYGNKQGQHYPPGYTGQHPMGAPPGVQPNPNLGPPPGVPAGPPGAARPAMSPPAGMPSATSPHPSAPRAGGHPGTGPSLPPNFTPPAGMPNINFSAPVIRLGTSGPPKGGIGGPDAGSGRSDSRADGSMGGAAGGGRNRMGLGHPDAHRGGPGGPMRGDAANAAVPLQEPTVDEVDRTLFVGEIPGGSDSGGLGGDEGVKRLLSCAGPLRKWVRAINADGQVDDFGFGEYEDVETLAIADEIFKDVEVPVERQRPKMDNGEDTEMSEAEDKRMMKVKLTFDVDENSPIYNEEFKSRLNENSTAWESRIQACRDSLKHVLDSFFNPPVTSAADYDHDTIMQDGAAAAKPATDPAEVIMIPLSAEDELADIPADMRETVAAEIAAFRERSNRRDLERMRREEEIEARATGGRAVRLPSPAGGANGVPLGPREKGVHGAPSGPKGFQGVQIPKDYQAGVSFVNGSGADSAFGPVPGYDRSVEDDSASDEELEARRVAKKEAEQERKFLDAERKWLNRERNRETALARERERERKEKEARERNATELRERLSKYDDDEEKTAKRDPYYSDHNAWRRTRAQIRSREEAEDERDRQLEARERAAEEEKSRGLVDSFLDRQAEELFARRAEDDRARAEGYLDMLGRRPTDAAPGEAQREPTRIRLTLGAAAAQRAQPAGRPRRSALEVEGLLEDEDEGATATRRGLVPIKDGEPLRPGDRMNDQQREEAAQALMTELPTDKQGLWNWPVQWDCVDETIMVEKLRPFIEKTIMDYLGVEEVMLVDAVEEGVRRRAKPEEIVTELADVMDEDAADLVMQVWRRLIYYAEAEKLGYPY